MKKFLFLLGAILIMFSTLSTAQPAKNISETFLFKVYNWEETFWNYADAESARAAKVTWCGNNNFGVISSSTETNHVPPFPDFYTAKVRYQDAPSLIVHSVNEIYVEKPGPWITETSCACYDYISNCQTAMNNRISVIAANNMGCDINFSLTKYDNEFWWCGGYCLSYYYKIRYQVVCPQLSKETSAKENIK